MFQIRKDIDLTNLIIEIVESERVHDIKAHLLEKKDVHENDNDV